MLNAGGEALAGLTCQTLAGDTSPSAVTPEGPSGAGRKGFGASIRPKGLRKRLHVARDMASALPGPGGGYAYASPSVGPDLKVWAVPQYGEDSLRALGLSIPLNSQNRSRPGLSGISVFGRKQVAASCRLMEDFRRKTAMWTVTLTDDDYLSLSIDGNWPKFQRRIIDLLVRHLKAAGDPAIVIGVCEVGAKRFARTGRPDPHMHIVTTGYGSRDPDGRWLLRPDVMDELVAKACQYAGLPSADRPACSQLSPVRHSVSSYLSKYLTKQMPVDLAQVDERQKALIPRQWWNQSEACKALVDGCLVKLPPAFAAFCIRQAILLERMDLGRGGVRTVGWKKTKLADIPVEVFCFKFRTPETLMVAMEFYALWVSNNEKLDLGELVMSG